MNEIVIKCIEKCLEVMKLPSNDSIVTYIYKTLDFTKIDNIFLNKEKNIDDILLKEIETQIKEKMMDVIFSLSMECITTSLKFII